MACSSLVALPRACGASGIIAGSEKLYIISFADLAPLSGSPTGEVYSAATSGIVNIINVASGKTFVEIGLTRDSTGINEVLTKDLKTGNAFFTQTLTVVLSELSIQNQAFISSVLNQPVTVILKARTGKYYVAGLNGLLELATVEGGSGIQSTDLNGYKMTFTGIDSLPIQIVDTTIIPSLI